MDLRQPLQEENPRGPLVSLEADVLLMSEVQASEREMVPDTVFCRELVGTHLIDTDVIEQGRQAMADASRWVGVRHVRMQA